MHDYSPCYFPWTFDRGNREPRRRDLFLRGLLCRFSTAHVARLDSTRLDTTRHGSSTGRFPPQIVPPGRGRGRLRERAVTYFCTRCKQHLRNPHMDRTHITTMDNCFGPLPYNFEPASPEGEQQPPNRGRHHGNRREIELWCQENQWRIGQVSW